MEEGPGAIRELLEWGVNFDPGNQGEDYELARAGGHTKRRILHAKDATGLEITSKLLEDVYKRQVIHHTPGRLRVRCGRGMFNHDQACGIECRLLKLKGVSSVTVSYTHLDVYKRQEKMVCRQGF